MSRVCAKLHQTWHREFKKGG